MAVTKQTSLPLSANGKLVELENNRGERETERGNISEQTSIDLFVLMMDL